MRNLFSGSGIATWALFLAVVAGVAVFMAATLMMALTAFGDSVMSGIGGELAGVGTFFMFWATVLTGGASVSSAGMFGVNMMVSVYALSISTLALIAIGVWLLARRASRREGVAGRSIGSVLLRAAIEGAAISLIVLLIAAIARVSVGDSSIGVTVQALVPGALAWPFFTVTFASFAGRLSTRPLMPTRTVAIMPLVREVLWYFMIPFAPLIIVAFVLLVVSGGSVGDGAWWMWFSLGVNLAAYVFGMAQFGSTQITGAMFGGSGSSSSHLWDQAGAWSIVIIIVTMLALVYTSIFIGARRQRTARFAWTRVWQLPVGVLVVWVFAALVMLPIGVGMPGGAGGSVAMTVNADTMLFVPLFAFLVSMLAEISPRLTYGMSPGLLAFLGGRRATMTWIAGTVEASTMPANPFAPMASYVQPVAAATPVSPATYAPATAPTGQGETPAAWAPAVPPVPAPGSPYETGDAPHMPGAAAAVPPAPDANATAAFTQTVAGQPWETSPIGDPNQTLPFTSQVPGAPAPIAPMSQKTKRRIIASVISAAMVVVLVVGAFIAIGILNGQRDPAAEVRSYLDAIARGDADAASSIIEPSMRNDERALLTNAAFAGDSKTIEVKSVETTSRSGEFATVDAVYTLDGERYTKTFNLQAGSKEFLVLDTWKFAPSEEGMFTEIAFDVSSNIPSVKIGDVEITEEMRSDMLSGELRLWAYPGEYAITYPDLGEYFEVDGDPTLRVVNSGYGGDYVYATASVTETQALQDAVLELVKAEATACVTIPTNMEDQCPYGLRQSDLSAMSLTKEFTGFEEFEYGYFRTTQGEYSTTQNPSTWNKNPKAETSTFTFTGYYEVVDGKVEISDLSAGWW